MAEHKNHHNHHNHQDKGFPQDRKTFLTLLGVAILGFAAAYSVTAIWQKFKPAPNIFKIGQARADTVSDTFANSTKISSSQNVVAGSNKVTLQRQY